MIYYKSHEIYLILPKKNTFLMQIALILVKIVEIKFYSLVTLIKNLEICNKNVIFNFC